MPTLLTPPVDANTPPNGVPKVAGRSAFAPIAADIAEADRLFAESLAGYRSPVAPLIQHLRHYRGKRLRPALLLLTAKACGGVNPHHHILAAAVEMIHTATLVHDDVLDEATTRRHIPTFNAEWGNKVSILLGDMLFTQAFHITSRVDRRACELIGGATNRVCGGELKQVCNRGNWHLSEADYFDILDGKTAALTAVCGRLGAVYAGVSEDVADKMETYGRCVGLAFQIADDLLDLTGDETKAGKTLGTDLEEGKLTLPLIHALNTLPSTAADELRDLIRSDRPDKRRKVAEVLTRTGSLAYAKRTAEEFGRQARAALADLPPSECKHILEQLTDWSVKRER
jgi:octaprenyl-diphosphate synthase